MLLRRFFVCIALLFSSILAANAQDTKAILVWSFFDGEHHVLSSYLTDDEWSEPVAIYSGDDLIVTPSLVKSGKGATMAVWSQQRLGKTQVFQSFLSESNNQWSEPEPLVDEGAENLNPNLINDGQGNLWLFWSGNNGGLDDIFYKKRKLDSQEWSEVQQLNEPNEVPDYKPIAELDEFGDIRVSWQTFDFLSGQYIEVQEVIVVEQKTAYSASKAAQDLKLEDIILPEFLPKDSAVSLLFPNNVAAQSIRID